MPEQSGNKLPRHPMYLLSVGDLFDGQSVLAHCVNCGHRGAVPVAVLRERCPPYTRVRDLRYRLRCERCRLRGKVEVTVGDDG
jgi:hypothetical protein